MCVCVVIVVVGCWLLDVMLWSCRGHVVVHERKGDR